LDARFLAQTGAFYAVFYSFRKKSTNLCSRKIVRFIIIITSIGNKATDSVCGLNQIDIIKKIVNMKLLEGKVAIVTGAARGMAKQLP